MPQPCPCHRGTPWDFFVECYSRAQHAYGTARHAQLAASKAAIDAQEYKAALNKVRGELQHLRARGPANIRTSNSELQSKLEASSIELRTCKEELQTTKAKLDEFEESLEREKRLRKEADDTAEVAYEAAHKSGAFADELRRELRKWKGEDSEAGDSHEPGTADLAVELVLSQQMVTYLEQMLQAKDPEYVREHVQQGIATTEKLKREVKDLTDELQKMKEENNRLKSLVDEEQDFKRTRSRKVRKSAN
ncbi:hypothetical protein DBV05_g12136 [Lasiodiplodia theobromae]|uniref:Uncharacterized protein n=1 Tax=Lasiodiplodia theobromae TaxID=45133 RepID=A0A5N5CV20_9PEZI|nr:hypothetical protein DBV05_g12136 [Lasiodiplodia theobromae]